MNMNWKGWVLASLISVYSAVMVGVIYVQWHPTAALCNRCDSAALWSQGGG